MKPRPKSSASISRLAFKGRFCCALGVVILLLAMNNGVSQVVAASDVSGTNAEKERALEEAKQKEDELRKTPPARKTDVVGGIPTDSEYLIFIIDTSGSMDSIARTVAKKLQETLAVFPRIKGMQIMNADGKYLYPQTAGGWLPATGNGRLDVFRDYIRWRDNSSSTPIGGLLEALKTYSKSTKEISIFVFGDDFTGKIDYLIQQVDSLNPVRSDGRRMIRIHGVGFPSAFGHDSSRGGGKFAKAMKALAGRNGGAFVSVIGPKGQERRQYLTGLRMDGERLLILVDASLSMLDTSVTNVARYYKGATPAKKLQSAKWTRVLNTVDWLLSTMGSEETWLKRKYWGEVREEARFLWNYPPEGGSNLERALKFAIQLTPKPDNIYILTDGLPDYSDSFISGDTVSANERLQHFKSAMKQIPKGAMPFNTIMFPFQDEPDAPYAYWRLAFKTNGSFFVSAEGWPN